METAVGQPEGREGELELTPRPRIKKLSSAIVWIVAIFAVAVLWLVGYLVSTKSRRASQERPMTAVPRPVEDLAERIKRAADREAQIAAERALEERSMQLAPPRELPPGFEELLAEQSGHGRMRDPMHGDPMLGDPARERSYGQGSPADTRGTTLERARDSELIPAAFRSATPRQAGAGQRTNDESFPSPPDLATLRADLVRAVQAKAGAESSPAAATRRTSARRLPTT